MEFIYNNSAYALRPSPTDRLSGLPITIPTTHLSVYSDATVSNSVTGNTFTPSTGDNMILTFLSILLLDQAKQTSTYVTEALKPMNLEHDNAKLVHFKSLAIGKHLGPVHNSTETRIV